MPANWRRAFDGRRAAAGVILAALLAGVSLSGCSGTGPSPATTSPAIPASVIPKLRADAARMAAANGDARPVWVKAVLTTHAAALRAISGGTVSSPPRQPVYLLGLHGKFVARDASIQPGGRVPAGTYAEAILGARSLVAMDAGLDHHAPAIPLSRLGPVTVRSRRS